MLRPTRLYLLPNAAGTLYLYCDMIQNIKKYFYSPTREQLKIYKANENIFSHLWMNEMGKIKLQLAKLSSTLAVSFS